MDLVDEQNIVGFEVGEQRREIARPLQHRTRGLAQIDAHLLGDDVRQRGLAQPRRAEQQHMVERLAPMARGLDEDFELTADLLLADVFGELLGAQRALERLVLQAQRRGRSGGRSRSCSDPAQTGAASIQRGRARGLAPGMRLATCVQCAPIFSQL